VNESKVLLVEFLTVAALVLCSMLGLVLLSVTNTSGDTQVVNVLADVIKVGLGALVALAYAARGVRRNGQ